jgi:hypothetical protein
VVVGRRWGSDDGLGVVRVRCGGTTGDSEDLVHFLDEELVFAVRKVTVHVELFEFGGDSFGAGIAVFFRVGGFAAGAGEGVDKISEGAGVAAEFVVEVSGFEVTKTEEKASDSELQDGLIEFGSVEIVEEIKGGFLVVPEIFEPLLLEQPVLVVWTGVPMGDVAEDESFCIVAEPVEDLLVFEAIAEHEIEFIADGLGEPGDLTARTVGIFGF